MKKIVCLSTIFLLFLTGIAFASNPIKLVINGAEVKSDVAPIIQNGRTLVPIRVVAENLGYTVHFNDMTQTVTVTAPQKEFSGYHDKTDFANDFEMAVQCLKEVNNHITEATMENSQQYSPVHLTMARGWLSTATKYSNNLAKYKTEDNAYALGQLSQVVGDYSFYLKAGDTGFTLDRQYPKGVDNIEFWGNLERNRMDASVGLTKLEYDILPKLSR